MSVPLMRDFMRTRLGLRLHLEVDAFQLIKEMAKALCQGTRARDLRRTIKCGVADASIRRVLRGMESEPGRAAIGHRIHCTL